MKPENILIVSNGSENRGDWTFKLADLGISNFKRGNPGRQDSADENTRGTRTYGKQCFIKTNAGCTDMLLQAPLKVTGLVARICMILSKKGRTPISGHWVAFSVKLPAGSRMGIEGSRYIGKNVNKKRPRSQASEMETAFTMARIFSIAYGNATRIAYKIYDPKTSLPRLLSEG